MSPTLYVFEHSVWSAAAELAVIELGFVDGQIKLSRLDLIHGKNYDPAFLKLNPNGTIPTLEAGDQVYTSTADTISYLVQNAPVKVRSGSPATIEAIHDDRYDPNFAMFAARNDMELDAKAQGIQGNLLSNRKTALEEYLALPGAEVYKPLYTARLGATRGLYAIYNHKVPADAQSAFFTRSQAHWGSVRSALFEIFPAFLPSDGMAPFIGGDVPGEDDFHLIAWLTRIAAAAGATTKDDALKTFEKDCGAPVPGAIADYWAAWVVRPSWSKRSGSGCPRRQSPVSAEIDDALRLEGRSQPRSARRVCTLATPAFRAHNAPPLHRIVVHSPVYTLPGSIYTRCKRRRSAASIYDVATLLVDTLNFRNSCKLHSRTNGIGTRGSAGSGHDTHAFKVRDDDDEERKRGRDGTDSRLQRLRLVHRTPQQAEKERKHREDIGPTSADPSCVVTLEADIAFKTKENRRTNPKFRRIPLGVSGPGTEAFKGKDHPRRRAGGNWEGRRRADRCVLATTDIERRVR
ncbi:hypothetical protein DFH07DRAFT_942883 [Mycena maculata]|uniref:GST N-terminal domain-containing protein n=1 Tax=Mycena maculata TaxID=230809 RepID=A0AAD7N3S5_9AGAR|nr:hypothetical protein DFH07DRAFT_942883 [Mycena maculata]